MALLKSVEMRHLQMMADVSSREDYCDYLPVHSTRCKYAQHYRALCTALLSTTDHCAQRYSALPSTLHSTTEHYRALCTALPSTLHSATQHKRASQQDSCCSK